MVNMLYCNKITSKLFEKRCWSVQNST